VTDDDRAQKQESTALKVKGLLTFNMDSIEQSVMISGIVYVFLGFVVRDWP